MAKSSGTMVNRIKREAFNDLITALLQFEEAGATIHAGEWYDGHSHAYLRLPDVRWDKDGKKLELIEDEEL